MQNNKPTRKKIRLKNYNYQRKGAYFVTICVKNRIPILGKIRKGKIKLTEEGSIANQSIKKIEQIYKGVLIDEFIIMPNHIHMIIILEKDNTVTLSRIIKQYKMYVSKQIKYSIWQKSFYERIIRNRKEYLNVKKYIINNPINWNLDKHN